MEIVPLTQLIRVKGTELTEFYGGESLKQVSKILDEKGFEKNDESTDGVVVTYEHPQYTKEGVNTWLTINLSGIVSEIKYTIAKL